MLDVCVEMLRRSRDRRARAEEAMAAGVDAAEKAMPRLGELLDRRHALLPGRGTIRFRELSGQVDAQSSAPAMSAPKAHTVAVFLRGLVFGLTNSLKPNEHRQVANVSKRTRIQISPISK